MRNVITLTHAAAERVRDLVASATRPVSGLRISVTNGGCAGMSYKLDYVEAPDPADDVVEEKGVRIFVDSKAVLFLLGTELDYQTSKLQSGFVFNNPNQTSACGCGESVALRPADPALLER